MIIFRKIPKTKRKKEKSSLIYTMNLLKEIFHIINGSRSRELLIEIQNAENNV
jgi:hypothetical protein